MSASHIVNQVEEALRAAPLVPAGLSSLPRSCKASISLCFWHEWNQVSTRDANDKVMRHFLSTALLRIDTAAATVPLSMIDLLERSSDPLHACQTLDQFAAVYCRHLNIYDLLNVPPEEAIARLLTSTTEPVPSAARGDYLLKFSWDTRLCLINTAGAHRIALARAIAIKHRLPVTITLPMTEVSIHAERTALLASQYFLRLVRLNTSGYDAIKHAITQCRVHVHEVSLPAPYQHYALWLFSNRTSHAVAIAHLLTNAGSQDFADTLKVWSE